MRRVGGRTCQNTRKGVTDGGKLWYGNIDAFKGFLGSQFAVEDAFVEEAAVESE
jgi:hypothetical protein